MDYRQAYEESVLERQRADAAYITALQAWANALVTYVEGHLC